MTRKAKNTILFSDRVDFRATSARDWPAHLGGHAVDERGERLHLQRRAEDDEQVTARKILAGQLAEARRQRLAEEHRVRLDDDAAALAERHHVLDNAL